MAETAYKHQAYGGDLTPGQPTYIGPLPRPDTDNPTGITPTEFKVLIEPKEVADKVGNVFLPQQAQDAEKYATIEGRIIAVSPLAFSYATAAEWEAAGAAKPKPGDRVLYAKYAGVRHRGRDGKEYIIANDKDIVGVLDD